MTFAEWLEELKKVAEDRGWEYLLECDPEDWREYYESGDEPLDVLLTELSYG